MDRVLSGIAPSGNFTLGNYLGALRHWVSFQETGCTWIDFAIDVMDFDLNNLRYRQKLGALRAEDPEAREGWYGGLGPADRDDIAQALQSDTPEQPPPDRMPGQLQEGRGPGLRVGWCGGHAAKLHQAGLMQ